MLNADDVRIVSRSPRGLERMLTIFVKVFGAFSLIISESKTAIMCMPIPRAQTTQIVFNATGQLGGAVTETPNLSDEIDQWIRAGWMSFRCYTRELYDHPKASLLHLKARMVKSEVGSRGSPVIRMRDIDAHYNEFRKTHHRMLLRILGAWCESPNNRTLSYKDALQ